jgi:hypothetical protein
MLAAAEYLADAETLRASISTQSTYNSYIACVGAIAEVLAEHIQNRRANVTALPTAQDQAPSSTRIGSRKVQAPALFVRRWLFQHRQRLL